MTSKLVCDKDKIRADTETDRRQTDTTHSVMEAHRRTDAR